MSTYPSCIYPFVEFEPLIHILDGSGSEHHTKDLGTSAAIEVVQGVVRHSEVFS